jgi:alkylhydroperoxidase family enzyme
MARGRAAPVTLYPILYFDNRTFGSIDARAQVIAGPREGDVAVTYPPRRITREEVAEDEVQFYDNVIGRYERTHADVDDTLAAGAKDANLAYWQRLMHSPEWGFHISQMGSIARSRGERGDSYSHVDREFVDQVLAVELGTNVVMGTHIPDGVALGVRIEAIEALRAGRDEDLTPEERQLAEFIRAVISGNVTAELWNGIEARMGERGVFDYTIFVLFLQFTMRFCQALGMPQMSNETVETMLQEIRDGTRKLPTDLAARFS